MTKRIASSLLIGLLGPMNPAFSATYFVTKAEDDDGPCTVDDCALREAVLAAQWPDPYPAEPDVVEIPRGTYRLSLSGPGAGQGLRGSLAVLGAHLLLRGDPRGGVVVQSDGTDSVLFSFLSSLDVEDVTFEGGRSDYGGGLDIVFGYLDLTRTTVRSNHAAVAGGGLHILEANVEIRNSTISGNSCDDRGGGVFGKTDISPPHASFSLINSTVSGNSAAVGAGLAGELEMGIGVHHTTLVANSAPVGSAIASHRPPFVENSLIEGDCVYSTGYSNGNNLESPGATCFSPHPGDLQYVSDLGLAPLDENGGPTATHALLRTSPAIDAARSDICLTPDQRGFSRPVDGDLDGFPRCDSGAFEFGGRRPAIEIPTLQATALWALALILALLGISRASNARKSI